MVDDFVYNANSEALIENVEIGHAQEVFESLIEPWQEMARKFLEDVPDSPEKKLLEQVPIAFTNELLGSDKNYNFLKWRLGGLVNFISFLIIVSSSRF